MALNHSSTNEFLVVNNMKKLDRNLIKQALTSMSLLVIALSLVACGGGDSDSGAVEATLPGSNTPSSFVGVYVGQLNLTAEALGIKESESVPITITVNADGTIRFDGDDPDETFTVGVSDNGNFSGNISIDEDPCEGTVGVTGTVDGVTAVGTVQGSGTCMDGGLTVNVELTGDFSASK